MVTLIAPHTLNSRSIVFPAEDVITVEMGRGTHQDCEKGLASLTGDSEIPMITGDRIVIRKAEVKNQDTEVKSFKLCRGSATEMRDS